MAKQYTLTAALLSLYVTSVCAEQVKLYTWEEYIAPAVISAFEKETGHSVELFYLDNDDDRDELILSGRGSNFDLVLVDNGSLLDEGQNKYFSTIPLDKVPNAIHISTDSRLACSNKGIAYAWGTIGLIYRESANPEGINSWMSLFEIATANNKKTVMLDSSTDSISIALIALQLPPFSTDKDHLRQAYELLKQQKPYLHSYGYGLTYALEHKADTDINLAVTFSGDKEQFIEATGQQDWRYVIPNEGAILWTDCLAIPASNKAIKKATLSFLNFINRPSIAKLNAETIWFATPNLSAKKLASQEYREDRSLFPPKHLLKNGFHDQNLPMEQLILRSRIMQKLVPYKPSL